MTHIITCWRMWAHFAKSDKASGKVQGCLLVANHGRTLLFSLDGTRWHMLSHVAETDRQLIRSRTAGKVAMMSPVVAGWLKSALVIRCHYLAGELLVQLDCARYRMMPHFVEASNAGWLKSALVFAHYDSLACRRCVWEIRGQVALSSLNVASPVFVKCGSYCH